MSHAGGMGVVVTLVSSRQHGTLDRSLLIHKPASTQLCEVKKWAFSPDFAHTHLNHRHMHPNLAIYVTVLVLS